MSQTPRAGEGSRWLTRRGNRIVMPMGRCCRNVLRVAVAIIGACGQSDAKRPASEGRSAAPESARVSQPVNPDQPGQSAAAGLQQPTPPRGAEIVVNGQPLSEETMHQLQ